MSSLRVLDLSAEYATGYLVALQREVACRTRLQGLSLAFFDQVRDWLMTDRLTD